MRRRTPGILTDYRSVLNSSGDIVVGAYARAQRRRRILVGAAGLALVGMACGLYFLIRPAEPTGLEGRVPVAVQCVVQNCGYRGVVRVPRQGAVFPMKCPQCGAHSCQKLWECRVCREQFLPKGQAGEVRCKCGSTQVGTAERLRDGGVREP